MTAFGDWFVATSKGLGYKGDADVARALGVSPSTVGRWRRGSRPSVQELVTISRVFNVHLEALLVLAGLVERDEVGRAEPPPPPKSFSAAERMIENAPIEEGSKEVLRTYWTRRMAEEHNRLELLLEMTVGPADNDSFARYVHRGEVSDPVLRDINKIVEGSLHADVLRVLTYALARNFRDPKRSRQASLRAAAERRARTYGCDDVFSSIGIDEERERETRGQHRANPPS